LVELRCSPMAKGAADQPASTSLGVTNSRQVSASVIAPSCIDCPADRAFGAHGRARRHRWMPTANKRRRVRASSAEVLVPLLVPGKTNGSRSCRKFQMAKEKPW